MFKSHDEIDFDVAASEERLKEYLRGEIDIPPWQLVYFSMLPNLFSLLNSLEYLPQCHRWALDGWAVEREQISSKKISVEGGGLYWLPGYDGSGCDYCKVDIARDSHFPLYSFKFYRGKKYKNLVLYVGKTREGWEFKGSII